MIEIPPKGCTCKWGSQFEGEVLGMVHTIVEVDRRCVLHGKKPRHAKV